MRRQDQRRLAFLFFFFDAERDALTRDAVFLAFLLLPFGPGLRPVAFLAVFLDDFFFLVLTGFALAAARRFMGLNRATVRPSASAACAAPKRATGTRYGLQET